MADLPATEVDLPATEAASSIPMVLSTSPAEPTEAASSIPMVLSTSPAEPAPVTTRLLSTVDSPVSTQSAAITAPGTAAAANPPAAVSQCNGTDNVGGQAVACQVTVTNNLNLATGDTSSIVEVEECHGAANAELTCVNSVTPSDELTTSVDQCNGSGSGGGGTVECNVHIVNNITGPAAPTPATINQCNGSGAGGGTLPTVMCDPIGNTTGATITQCNDSGNGGGGTMRVQCTVTPSTETSVLPVDVNQCNGSGNGGGSTVTCTVSVTNNIITEPPPVVEPPVVEPPVVEPPVVEPPVVEPPVVEPPVVEPPVAVRQLVVPPVVATPVVEPSPTPQLQDEATTPPVITATLVPSATPVSTMAVTPVLTTAFTLTPQTVTPRPAGPQGTETTVQTAVPAISTTVVAAASRSTELVPAQIHRPVLALTGLDSRWMLLLAALAMALGGLAVRLGAPTTMRSPIGERTSR